MSSVRVLAMDEETFHNLMQASSATEHAMEEVAEQRMGSGPAASGPAAGPPPAPAAG